MDNDTSGLRVCTGCRQSLSVQTEYFKGFTKCKTCTAQLRHANDKRKAEQRKGEVPEPLMPEVPDGARLIPVNGRRPDAQGKNITTIVAWAIVSAEDFDRLSGYIWHLNAGYVRRTALKTGRHGIPMHHDVLPPAEGQLIDHVNGNKTDNRRENLRPTDSLGNSRNAALYASNLQGYKGVGKEKWGKPYRARITIDKKTVRIGAYDTPEEAAKAYDAAAKEHFGEFARLNFPNE